MLLIDSIHYQKKEHLMIHKYSNYEQFLRLRLWLKIGLAQEKKGAYDSAATSYLEAIKLTEKYFDSAEIENLKRRKNEKNTTYHAESLNDLKLFYQAHFCLAYLQEKTQINSHTNLRLVERFIERLQNLLNKQRIINKLQNILKKRRLYKAFSSKLINLSLFFVECLTSVGDLLYLKGFKVSNLSGKTSLKSELFFMEKAEEFYFHAIDIILKYYFINYKPTSKYKNKIHNLKLNSIFLILFLNIEKNSENFNNFNYMPTSKIFYILAVNLSKLGDTLLSKLDQNLAYFTKQKYNNLLRKASKDKIKIESFITYKYNNIYIDVDNISIKQKRKLGKIFSDDIMKHVKKSIIDINMLSIYLDNWKKLHEGKKSKEKIINQLIELSTYNRIIMIISYYLLAARLFLRAAMHKECAFEYEKIIRTLRYCEFNYDKSSLDNPIIISNLIENLSRAIFEPGKKHYQLSYLNIHHTIQETNTYNDSSTGDYPSKEASEVDCLNLHWSYLKDILIKEYKVYFEKEKKIKIDNEVETLSEKEKKLIKKVKEVIEKVENPIGEYVHNISQEDHFDDVMNRIAHLSFKAQKQNELFRSLIGLSVIRPEECLDITNEDDVFEKVLSRQTDDERRKSIKLAIQYTKDGIFCCHHSIILRELQSNTYWWLHLALAFMHLFLAHWAQRYHFILKYIKEKKENLDTNQIEQEIKNYVGIKNMKYIDYIYQLQQALENFHQVKETHTGGKAYKDLIQRMYYLNDDFNDRAYHFYLAQERFELRSGKVHRAIKAVEKLIENAKATKHDRINNHVPS